MLPSDSSKRGDLAALSKGDIEEAQKQKNNIEQLQRKDQIEREKYYKKK